MKNTYKKHYNFTVTHKLANGAEVTESEIIELMKKLPPIQVEGVEECNNASGQLLA